MNKELLRRKTPLLRIMRRHGFTLRLASCFCAVFAATFGVGLEDSGSLIWVANGLLLSFLLLAPRWRWRYYFAVGFAAILTGGLAAQPAGWARCLALTILNVGEVAIGAFLLRKRSTVLPQFTDREYLLKFVGYAVVAGPLASGLIFALAYSIWMKSAPWNALLSWVTTDGLGTSIVAPGCIALFRSKLHLIPERKSDWLYPAAFVAVTFCACSQTRLPVIVLLYPLAALILFRFGLGWAAMSTLFVAAVGSWYTVHGVGPFAKAGQVFAMNPTITLQLYIASGMFMIFAASSVMDTLYATERRLQEIVTLHQLVMENSRDVIILADFDGNRNYVSAAGQLLMGWSAEDILRHQSLDLVHPDDKRAAEAIFRELRTGGQGRSIECRIRKPNGQYIWMEASLRTVCDPKTGRPSGILNMVRDISQRKRAEQAREFQQSLLRAIHEVSLDGILVVGTEGNVVSYNRRFAEVWRIPSPESAGDRTDNCGDLADEQLLAQCIDRTKDPASFVERVQELYADRDANDHCQVELKDGRTLERYTTSLRSDAGQYLGRVWFFRDITDRRRAEEELQTAYRSVEALAVTDSLTRLANRRKFDQYLSAEWRRGIREHFPISLLLLDVDWFKSYNDAYGHLRGDSCLKQIAESAMDVVTRPSDLVARIGGEEFAVVLPNTSRAGAREVAKHICAALQSRGLPHSSNPLGIVTISVGCATMIPTLGQHSSVLTQRADEALYAAKRNGRNQVCDSEQNESEHTVLQAS